MALRIGPPAGGPPMPPPDEAAAMPDMTAMPPDAMAAPPEAMPTEPEGDEGGFIDPESARYFGPESRCAGCIHFMGPNACEIVSGPIDPQGVCMLFLAGGAPTDMPPTDAMPTGAPEEAPEPPTEKEPTEPTE